MIHYIFLALIYLTPLGFSIWCMVRLFRNQKDSWIYQLQRSFGWVILPAFLVVLLQPFLLLLQHGIDDVSEVAVSLFGSWPVLVAGQTVITIFEDNVKDWTGHRRDTMFDNAPVFLGLMAAQTLVLTMAVYWRFRSGKTWRDPLVLGIGIFLLINAILAKDWPWYGT